MRRGFEPARDRYPALIARGNVHNDHVRLELGDHGDGSFVGGEVGEYVHPLCSKQRPARRTRDRVIVDDHDTQRG
jgi:hypothetical protein